MPRNIFKKKLFRDIEAKGKVSLVAILFFMVCISTIFIILPDDTVSAAYTDFSNHKLITISNIYIDTSLSDFPIWVYNISDDFKDTDNGGIIQPDGDDIAFYSFDNNTQYAHELELYDGSTGTIGVWVNISDVISSAIDTSFWVYYGDSDGLNQEDVADTWDDYIAVYHFANASGDLHDSLDNVNMSAVGSPAYQNIGGTGGYCINFTEETDYFRTTSDYGDGINGSTSFSILAVHKSDGDTDEDGNVIWFPCHERGVAVSARFDESGDPFRFRTDQSPPYSIDSTTNLNEGVWYHSTAVFDKGNNISVYTNGSWEDSSSFTGVIDSLSEDYNTIACKDDTGGGFRRYFGGELDEVHIAAFAFNSSWINAAYNNMMDVGSFLTFGVEDGTIHFVSINDQSYNSFLTTPNRYFNWTHISGATAYNLQISNSSAFGSTFLDLSDINEVNYGVNYTVKGRFVEFILPYEYNISWYGSHYYRVRAYAP